MRKKCPHCGKPILVVPRFEWKTVSRPRDERVLVDIEVFTAD